MLPWTRLIQSIWFVGIFYSMHVHNTPSRPGLFLSATAGFLERAKIFKQKFPGVGPSKKHVSMFFTRLQHRPGPLTKTMIQIERLRFRHNSSMMTRSRHDCWHVRTNKCARTNICKTSVFVVSVRNINIFGRILTQFTCLLRANTVAVKRNLLTACTCLGKSESVALRKNGPYAGRRTKIAPVKSLDSSEFSSEFSDLKTL